MAMRADWGKFLSGDAEHALKQQLDALTVEFTDPEKLLLYGLKNEHVRRYTRRAQPEV